MKLAKKKKKKSNYYFTQVTQDKLVEYQNSKHKRKKDDLYREHIHPAFKELVHNLVSVYKFKSSAEDINHLKHDCVTFLFETIHKWNPNNGTKAFSYFNVVAKNWLTIHSRRLLKNSNRNISVDSIEEFSAYEKEQLNRIEPDISEVYESNIDDQNFMPMFIDMTNCIRDKLKDEKDFRCIDAIQQVFKNVDNLDYLNKRAVFVYLREISGLNSSELSSSLSTIRKHYRKICGPSTEFYLF
jgi:hypothetical protein